MEKTPMEIIKETVEGLLRKMEFEASVTVTAKPDDEETLLCRVQVAQDQNLLIGQYGVNLAALQHLVRVILRKKTEHREHPLNLVVDINEYFADKQVVLEQEAEKAAQEALRDNLPITLRPMFPYERKIVHTFLAQDKRVITESVGFGDTRKITVRPRAESSEDAS